MKIAYLFSRYPVPSQTFCDTEIRALEAAGHEIGIYSCSPPTSSFRHGGRADWPRAEVFYAPPTPVLKAWESVAHREGSWPGTVVREHELRFGTRYDPARRARHALYFSDRFRRHGVEHLHVHFANRATHAALFIHALTGIPFSFTAHAQDFLVDLGNDELLRLMCERAACVVAVSEWSRRELIARCPAAEQKIHRVYNGLVLDQWVKYAPAEPSFDTKIKIFSLGRLIEFKGFEDLLAACRILSEREVKFSCEIAGEGPLRETLEKQAAAFNHPDGQIQFSGLLSQDEVHARMTACDIFALACRVDEKGACDVLPTVILEAMVCARPVVSTRLAGIPEMVEDGHTGMLVPPGDAGAFADALQRLAADDDERHRMGRAGRGAVTEKFSAANSADRLGALFGEASAAKSHQSVGNIPTDLRLNVFCLVDRWPPEAIQIEALPFGETVLLALKPGQFSEHHKLHRAAEYLPDDVVFETHWRQTDPLIHRMEGWRGEVGGGCSTEEYLLACRRAYYLHRTLLAVQPTRQMHLHAMGPESLLCTWLLRRLKVAKTASFLLPSTGGEGIRVAGSVLRKLAPDFAGGWVADERKLAESLGPSFHASYPDGAAWSQNLRNWSGS